MFSLARLPVSLMLMGRSFDEDQFRTKNLTLTAIAPDGTVVMAMASRFKLRWPPSRAKS